MERTFSIKRKLVKIPELSNIQLFEALHETMRALPLLATNSDAYMEQLREFGMLKGEYSKRKKEHHAELYKAEQEFRVKLRRKITGDLAELSQRAGSLGNDVILTRTAGIMPTTANPRPIADRIHRTVMDIRRRNKIKRRKEARAKKAKQTAEKAKQVIAKFGISRRPK